MKHPPKHGLTQVKKNNRCEKRKKLTICFCVRDGAQDCRLNLGGLLILKLQSRLGLFRLINCNFAAMDY